MNSKERVIRTLQYQETDRAPAGIFGTASDYEDALVRQLGSDSYEQMYDSLGIDLWHCRAGLEYTGNDLGGGWWGIYPGVPPPFSDVSSIDEVEAHNWPDIADFNGDRLAQEIWDHQEFGVVGGINSAVFHWYLWLCGQENGMAYLITQPDVAEAIICRITDFWVGYLQKVLEAGKGGIDIIENCNDFGTQLSMFISAAMFRRFFKPALNRLYDVSKSYGVKMMQHSCGAVSEIIPDFLEMGADILNPIQITADGMSIDRLVAEYKGKIVFYGGLDTQYLLPQGPAERIREETRRVLNLFGNTGGYILSGSQGLMMDIPVEHALAMFGENMKGWQNPIVNSSCP